MARSTRHGQAACFQQPSSSAWTALNLMKGQIQFQNFVAMWLSRRRDSRHIFGLARLGTIWTAVQTIMCCLVEVGELLKKFWARFTKLASRFCEKSICPWIVLYHCAWWVMRYIGVRPWESKELVWFIMEWRHGDWYHRKIWDLGLAILFFFFFFNLSFLVENLLWFSVTDEQNNRCKDQDDGSPSSSIAEAKGESTGWG